MNNIPPNRPIQGIYYYIFEGRGSFNLLHFYEDGFVMAVTVAGGLDVLPQVLEWFTREMHGMNPESSTGWYSTTLDLYVNFNLNSDTGKIVYTGEILDNGNLLIYSHSHINGNADSRTYQPIPNEREDRTMTDPNMGGAAPRLD